jgi:hypothetical protein
MTPDGWQEFMVMLVGAWELERAYLEDYLDPFSSDLSLQRDVEC